MKNVEFFKLLGSIDGTYFGGSREVSQSGSRGKKPEVGGGSFPWRLFLP